MRTAVFPHASAVNHHEHPPRRFVAVTFLQDLLLDTNWQSRHVATGTNEARLGWRRVRRAAAAAPPPVCCRRAMPPLLLPCQPAATHRLYGFYM
jgi:hypothetical protein